VKYLLFTPELFAAEGGIARILRLYLKALCEVTGERDSVGLLSLNDRSLEEGELRLYSNKKLSEWEVCSRSKLRFVKTAFRMSRSCDAIICGHIGQLPVAWALSKLRPQLSYYLVAHGIEVWRPYSFLERHALRGAKAILCVSDFTRRKIAENCRIEANRLLVLPNALDPHLEPTAPSAPPAGGAVVLTISRLSAADNYKGIGHLIEAMPAVRAKNPGARLRIVGRGDGLPALQALARRLELKSVVEFAGYLSDSEIHQEFGRCSLFALPSQKEGFGLVYLEAMANGRPCLGAREGGTPEVISPETGVLVEYGNVPEISGAICAALARHWEPQALRDRAQYFSYLRFKERFASVICA
jgi:phosphatidylinositol alpha-1,6-mannosyltransferase